MRNRRNIPSNSHSEISLLEEDTCAICQAEFLDPEDLKIHIKQVHKQPELVIKPCVFCSTVFSDDEDLILHIRDVHLCSLNCCQYCSRLFLSNTDLIHHENQHRSKNGFCCSQCSETFKYAAELENHEVSSHLNNNTGVLLGDFLPLLSSLLNYEPLKFIRSINSGTMYSCIQCNYSSQSAEDYVRHLHKKNCVSYACDTCSNVYKTLEGLSKHICSAQCMHNVKKDDKKECKKCRRMFLKAVIKVHSKNCNPLKCLNCNLIFETMYELSEHQLREHPITVTLTTCKYCMKQFGTEKAQEKHIERCHKDELHLYKYRCIECDIPFKHPKLLFSHYLSKHKNLKPYSCTICDKKFKYRRMFTFHIKLEHKSLGIINFNEDFHVVFSERKNVKETMNENNVTNIDNSDVQEEGLKITDKEPLNTGESDVSKDHIVTEGAENVSNCVDNNEKQTNLIPTESQGPDDTEKNHLDNKMPNIEFQELEYLTEYETNKNEEEKNKTSVDKIEVTHLRKSMRRKENRSKKRFSYNRKESSDSDDEPLLKIKKQNKIDNRKIRRKKSDKKFTCKICNKYCYTFQNFNNHMSTHTRNGRNKCVKCSKTFKSELSLKHHIEKEHSSSQLTEKLKNLLEKRKQVGQQISREEDMKRQIREKFLKTIKKVDCSKGCVKAKITPVFGKESLSVQKFIENFVPDVNDATKKDVTIENSVTMKMVSVPYRTPLIKMKKFVEEPYNIKPTLSLPVKFKESEDDYPQAKIRISFSKGNSKSLNFGTVYKCFANNDEKLPPEEYTEQNDEFIQTQDDNETIIPDVAEEVMLEEGNEFPQKIILPNVPDKILKQFRIAHLTPQAPYFKIIKVNDLLKEHKKSVTKEAQVQNEDVKLPQGMKLVTVNPLAHLLDEKVMKEITKSEKKPKQTKRYDVEFAKALMKMNNYQYKPKKRKLSQKQNDLNNIENNITEDNEIIEEVLDEEFLSEEVDSETVTN